MRDTTQPFLLARGLAGVGFVHVLRGDAQGSNSPLEQAIQLCLDQGFAYFHAILSSFEGANLVHLGRTEEGIVRMRASIAKLHEVGAEVLFTIVLGQLASAHLALGEVSEGLTAVDEGLDCARRNGERWGEAELHRLRGQLLLARGFGAAEEADACFERAILIARGQRANAYWLRAAASRARLCHRQGRTAQAAALLSEALSVWPEHTESADLRAARTLRHEIAPND